MASDLELRTCGRAGCRWPAAASLSFRYDTRQVWLLDLAPQPHPSLYDLCPHHSDSLTVPRGWERVDEREPHEAVHEPSGRDLDVRMTSVSQPARPGGNRYAALSEQLPRLARQYGAVHAPTVREPGSPVPARDLAPLPVEEPVRSGEAQDPPVEEPVRSGDAQAPPVAEPMSSGDVNAEADADHQAGAGSTPGQLAIPVDALDDTPAGHAVVVSIEKAGARRRDASVHRGHAPGDLNP